MGIIIWIVSSNLHFDYNKTGSGNRKNKRDKCQGVNQKRKHFVDVGKILGRSCVFFDIIEGWFKEWY